MSVTFRPRFFEVALRDEERLPFSVQLKCWIYDDEEQSVWWELRRFTNFFFRHQMNFDLWKWIKKFEIRSRNYWDAGRVRFWDSLKPSSNAARYMQDPALLFDPYVREEVAVRTDWLILFALTQMDHPQRKFYIVAEGLFRNLFTQAARILPNPYWLSVDAQLRASQELCRSNVQASGFCCHMDIPSLSCNRMMQDSDDNGYQVSRILSFLQSVFANAEDCPVKTSVCSNLINQFAKTLETTVLLEPGPDRDVLISTRLYKNPRRQRRDEDSGRWGGVETREGPTLSEGLFLSVCAAKKQRGCYRSATVRQKGQRGRAARAENM